MPLRRNLFSTKTRPRPTFYWKWPIWSIVSNYIAGLKRWKIGIFYRKTSYTTGKIFFNIFDDFFCQLVPVGETIINQSLKFDGFESKTLCVVITESEPFQIWAYSFVSPTGSNWQDTPLNNSENLLSNSVSCNYKKTMFKSNSAWLSFQKMALCRFFGTYSRRYVLVYRRSQVL